MCIHDNITSFVLTRRTFKMSPYIMTHLEHGLKLKILDLYDDGRYTQKEIANRFKISDRTIKKRYSEIY